MAAFPWLQEMLLHTALTHYSAQCPRRSQPTCKRLSRRQIGTMATRKTVAHMDEAEKEYKRWNDRVNQQYSRARKKRRFEELQTQNKILKAELETTKVELESFRRREAAVRSALDWVSTIVNDSSTTGSKPPPKPAANSEQHEAPTRSSDTNSSTSSTAAYRKSSLPCCRCCGMPMQEPHGNAQGLDLR